MDMDIRQTREAVDIFNNLNDKLRDKLLIGIKCLLFLQNLADNNDDDKPAQQPA